MSEAMGTGKGRKTTKYRKKCSGVTVFLTGECVNMETFVVSCCSLLFLIVPCCPLLFLVVPCCSLLFLVVPCCSLLFLVVPCCSLLFFVVLLLLLLVVVVVVVVVVPSPVLASETLKSQVQPECGFCIRTLDLDLHRLLF